ncbi:DUF6660 family protein [Zobellia sp. OII3]|nr:DUF6660 family protein [Zobellia sp. OII3]
MKLLTFILSIYFLALNVVPCSDMEPLADGQVSVVADSGDGYGMP